MKKSRIVSLVVQGLSMALIVGGLIVGNYLTKVYELPITTELCPEIVDEEVRDMSSVSGQAMSSLIMEEGAVLLKNDGVLPLKKSSNSKVNVFGWRSVEWLYCPVGTNSSAAIGPEDGNAETSVDFLEALETYGIEYNKDLTNMYKSYFTPHDFATNPKPKG